MTGAAPRTVLVTGGARRIGAALARAMAEDGWMVLIHHHSSGDDAARLADEIAGHGGRCATVAADLSRRADIEQLIGRCTAAHGPIGCLINNASSFRNDTIDTVTWDSFDAHWMPNFAAPLMLSRDFARALGELTGGCIVNLLDQKIANLNPDFLSYTLSKVALGGLTQMLAMAFRDRIRVCGVAPGVTLISGRQTPESFDRAWRATPLGRSSTPEEIVAAVRFVLAEPRMTGETIFLDGGEGLKPRKRDVAFDT